MNEKKVKPGAGKTTREDRLAKALRDNLRRRKVGAKPPSEVQKEKTEPKNG